MKDIVMYWNLRSLNISWVILLAAFNVLACSGCNSSDSKVDGSADSGNDDIIKPSFVSIPGGTFTMGSPETEPCRAAYAEDLIESVTLTYPFAVSRTEVTQEQWESLGFPNPSHHVCPKCPVHMVNWYEAAAYCNELSTREGLTPCYDMSSCEGTVGGGCAPDDDACADIDVPVEKRFQCTQGIRSNGNYWECTGYRLPTVAEWEYAARAGTSTATYNGDLPSDLDGCDPQETVDPIAWHCGLSDHVVPVGLLQPNVWGLYGALGNAEEWTDTAHDGLVLGHGDQELVNPSGPDVETMRRTASKMFLNETCLMRAAAPGGDVIQARNPGLGFRVVRTLESVDDGPSDPPPEVPTMEFDDGDGMDIEWVSIPGGEYVMGSAEEDAPEEELPAHTVTVTDFDLTRSEATVSQYGECVEAGQCPEPYDGPLCNFGWEGVGSHPVNCVDLDGARAFCAWAGGRLPTEAEWEYAARNAGAQPKRPWGDEAASCERVSMNEDGEYACGLGSPGPVCSYEAGDTTEGICDMLGGVWEWVEDDWHFTYEGAPADGSAWMGGGPPGVGTRRGGSFDLGARDLHSRRRDGAPASARYFNTGLRCARD